MIHSMELSQTPCVVSTLSTSKTAGKVMSRITPRASAFWTGVRELFLSFSNAAIWSALTEISHSTSNEFPLETLLSSLLEIKSRFTMGLTSVSVVASISTGPGSPVNTAGFSIISGGTVYTSGSGITITVMTISSSTDSVPTLHTTVTEFDPLQSTLGSSANTSTRITPGGNASVSTTLLASISPWWSIIIS